MARNNRNAMKGGLNTNMASIIQLVSDFSVCMVLVIKTVARSTKVLTTEGSLEQKSFPLMPGCVGR